MINEYLFLSDWYRSAVEAYRPNNVMVEISNIENTQLWIAAFSVVAKTKTVPKSCLKCISP